MRSIVFNVKPDIGHEEQSSLLTRLDQLPGIHRTAALSPNSKSPAVRRMCYAYVDDGADIETLRDQIARLPEVESANVPAERRLAGGGAGASSSGA